MGQGMKSVATQATKATVKQAVKQTAKVGVPVGLAIEGICWGYEIKCAHNKKKVVKSLRNNFMTYVLNKQQPQEVVQLVE